MHASPRAGAGPINLHFNDVDATGATFADAMVKGGASVPVNVYADGLKTSNDSVIFELDRASRFVVRHSEHLDPPSSRRSPKRKKRRRRKG